MRDEIIIKKFIDGSLELSTVPYTLIQNKIVNKIKDAAALGLYGYILCCQHGNIVDVNELARHFKCSKDEIHRGLNVLKDMNFLSFD